ncbi:MAG: NAD(P)-dependent oxidoreductase [Actinomycetota bacterium]|nr:NAD(P)-dependent oxidoreductase [Actinomycetota bacterium]
MTTVTVVGTGLMGSGIARSLLRAGHEVRVWNRTVDKARPLAQDGASVHESLATAVAGADVVLTMVFDADALDPLVEQLLSSMTGDAIWLQAATIGPDAAQRFAQLAANRGIGFVDAPVLGTKEPAEQGTLVALAAGPERIRPSVMPVLAAITSRTLWVSEKPGDGHRLKLVANSWVLSLVCATAQAVALAEGQGLDPQLFLDAISGGASDCAYAQVKAKAMMGRSFPPSFTLEGAFKDSGLIADSLRGAGLDDSLMAAINGRFRVAAEQGHGGEDTAAVILALTP